MKILTVGLFLITSNAFAANPAKIVCDSRGIFGLKNLTRIELNKQAADTYHVTIFKEVSCGDGTGCMQLVERGNANVYLMESPTIEEALVSFENDKDNDFKIDVRRKLCKIHMTYNGGVREKFNGKIVDLVY